MKRRKEQNKNKIIITTVVNYSSNIPNIVVRFTAYTRPRGQQNLCSNLNAELSTIHARLAVLTLFKDGVFFLPFF